MMGPYNRPARFIWIEAGAQEQGWAGKDKLHRDVSSQKSVKFEAQETLSHIVCDPCRHHHCMKTWRVKHPPLQTQGCWGSSEASAQRRVEVTPTISVGFHFFLK
jgi:hypothetical protein